ncbi:MAG: hypothetical protein QF609_06710, partial [Gammaproteobacteria bacterium]|nr:hypothetical protein [Gammaproteobacteria bacterium]
MVLRGLDSRRPLRCGTQSRIKIPVDAPFEGLSRRVVALAAARRDGQAVNEARHRIGAVADFPLNIPFGHFV